ncbi:MAG: cell division protein FtsA [Cyclobacteriaceae bacterium]
MSDNKIVVGLDIGTTKICVIVGRKNEYGKLEILGMGKAVSDGVIRGMVTNIDKTVNAINKAIQLAEDESGVSIGEVNVGIAGQHIKSSINHGSIMRDSQEDEIGVTDVNRLTQDMYKIVTPPGNEIIHVMPQDYTVDFEEGINDPVGMVGMRLEADFHVITAHTTAINNINKCVRRAESSQRGSMEIMNLVLEPLASSLAVLSEEEKEAGVAIIDIGGGTTDLAVFHDNIIRHTAVIPFGGNIITSDIKDGCNVLQNQAEQLKMKFGKAISNEASEKDVISIPGLRNRAPKEISVKNLACIIEARMQEIIELIHSEIVRSGYENKLAGGLVITGGGSQLKHVRELFEYMTGIDARVGFPNEHLGKSRFDGIKSPSYATGIGLVLSGFRAIDDRENKYNEFQLPLAGNKVLKKDQGKEFFKKILDRTKGLLLDDLED